MSTEAVEITIGGHKFNLRTENSAQLKDMAEYVDQKLKEVTGVKKEVSIRAALLVALNLTEEIYRQRDKNRRLLEAIKTKAEGVKKHLESVKENLEQVEQ